MKNNDNSSSTPPIMDPDDIDQFFFFFFFFFLDSEKAKILNKYFVSISTVDDNNTPLPGFE